MKILLTGASGFIGKNLVEYLSRFDYEMICPQHSEMDLTDEVSTAHFFQKNRNIDIVIHTANTRTQAALEYDILNNGLRMFYNLEKYSTEYGKMYYLGSGAEYNRKTMKSKVSESDFGASIPQDPYGFAKYVIHKESEKNNNICELCLFGVFGKYEEWQRRFISNNIVRSINNMPMTLSQNAWFDYLYIDDFCRIMHWFIEHNPQYKHYNVCRGVPVDLLSLGNMINEVSGLGREIIAAKEGFQRDYTADNSRLLAELGEFEFTDNKDAITEMYKYYSEHISEFDKTLLK